MASERRKEQWREYGKKRRENPVYTEAQKERYRKWAEKNAHTPERLERRAAQMRAYRKNPALAPKMKARLAVRNALSVGKLSRGECEVCGSQNTEAHHDDYSKPLDVRWLCRTHHRQHHSKATT